MKRTTRFAVNTLAPPAIVTLIMSGAIAAFPENWENVRIGAAIWGFFWALCFAYFYGLIPSLIHAALMDWVQSIWDLQARPKRVAIASTFSGLGLSSLIAFTIGGIHAFERYLAWFPVVGATTGAATGLLVTRFERGSIT